MRKKYISLLTFLFVLNTSYSQITIVPPNGISNIFNLEQLTKFQIINAGSQPIRGTVSIEISLVSGDPILNWQSGPILLSDSETKFGQTINWSHHIHYGHGSTSKHLKSTGQLPAGNYSICYRLVDQTSNQQISRTCMEHSQGVIGLPSLVYPFNESTIQENNPVLQWRAPLPIIAPENVTYTIHLVEQKENQNANMALRSNAPLIYLTNLSTQALTWPAEVPSLENGNTYTWQVIAYLGNQHIGSTEIWTFQVGTAEKKKANNEENFSFRAVKPQLDGGYYRMVDKICFSFDNRPAMEALEYSIHLTGDSTPFQDELPFIALKYGINQIVIAKSELPSLGSCKKYIMKISGKNGQIYYLPFDYFSSAEL